MNILFIYLLVVVCRPDGWLGVKRQVTSCFSCYWFFLSCWSCIACRAFLSVTEVRLLSPFEWIRFKNNNKNLKKSLPPLDYEHLLLSRIKIRFDWCLCWTRKRATNFCIRQKEKKAVCHYANENSITMVITTQRNSVASNHGKKRKKKKWDHIKKRSRRSYQVDDTNDNTI